MELNLLSGRGAAAKKVNVSDAIFGGKVNEALVHQIVTAYRNAGRAGTQAQKTRAEVSGGGKKPWRQKGTGRARAGTTRGPIWRGGGVTFAAKPRSYAHKVNRKMYQGAMRSILAELVKADRLHAVDDLALETPKTKAFLELLKKWELNDVLIVVDEMPKNLILAARNLYFVDIKSVNEIDPVSLLLYQKTLITEPALKKLEEQLA